VERRRRVGGLVVRDVAEREDADRLAFLEARLAGDDRPGTEPL
jgi:hypothetical protein